MKERVLAALSREISYVARPQPKNATQSAVLVLCDVLDKSSVDEIRILITQRSDEVETHKGHFAFPGGICEPDELSEPDGKIQTALRELHEEVGISGDVVEVLGTLPLLATLSGFQIQPVVAVLRTHPEEIKIQPQVNEVSQVFWCSLATLEQCKTQEKYTLDTGFSVTLPVFLLSEGRVWGATAIMLENLIQRLKFN